MQEALIHCRHCGAVLRVPERAAGARARCAECGQMFTVPTEAELLEETISSWIEQDVDEALTRKESVEEKLRPTVERPRETDVPADDGHAAMHGRSRRERELARMRMKRRRREADPPADDGGVAEEEGGAEPGPAMGERLTGETWSITELKRKQRQDREQAAQAATERKRRERALEAAEEAEPDGSYPQELLVSEPQPRLVVRRVEPVGVTFAFDSMWLKHEGFRASMPVRCAWTGQQDRAQLIARPMVFLDQERGRKHTIEQLAATHENRQIGDRSPRSIARQMGRLEAMPSPFNRALPYYVAGASAHEYLHCVTRDRKDGITCEVIIPDLATALEWLKHVNGVCGEEYRLLSREAAMLHGPAWKALPEQVRQRIGVWCKLQPREQFRLYLSDADFGKRDQGLAGLVVTDQRLVFHKYHNGGEMALGRSEAEIVAKCDDRFASLSLLVGSERLRMIKVHRNELAPLQNLLENQKAAIRVVVHES